MMVSQFLPSSVLLGELERNPSVCDHESLLPVGFSTGGRLPFPRSMRGAPVFLSFVFEFSCVPAPICAMLFLLQQPHFLRHIAAPQLPSALVLMTLLTPRLRLPSIFPHVPLHRNVLSVAHQSTRFLDSPFGSDNFHDAPVALRHGIVV